MKNTLYLKHVLWATFNLAILIFSAVFLGISFWAIGLGCTVIVLGQMGLLDKLREKFAPEGSMNSPDLVESFRRIRTMVEELANKAQISQLEVFLSSRTPVMGILPRYLNLSKNHAFFVSRRLVRLFNEGKVTEQQLRGAIAHHLAQANLVDILFKQLVLVPALLSASIVFNWVLTAAQISLGSLVFSPVLLVPLICQIGVALLVSQFLQPIIRKQRALNERLADVLASELTEQPFSLAQFNTHLDNISQAEQAQALAPVPPVAPILAAPILAAPNPEPRAPIVDQVAKDNVAENKEPAKQDAVRAAFPSPLSTERVDGLQGTPSSASLADGAPDREEARPQKRRRGASRH